MSTSETVAAFRAALVGVVREAQSSGIPAFCIRRELRGHLASLAEGEEDGQLWCVHVLGPDTVIAQPSKAVAEARAELWNEDIKATRERSRVRWVELYGESKFDDDILLECHAEPYPYSAEGHASGLAEHGGEPEDIC